MVGMELIISSICNATFCEATYDNPISESQLTHKQTEYLALANEINGKHLKIATYNNYPLSGCSHGENDTLIGFGVAFTIVKILQKKFNFTYEVVQPENDYLFGGTKPEDSLIGLLNSSKVDMAAAFLPKLINFRKMVTFSTHLNEGTWMMMLKRPKASAAGSGLMAPFNSFVWYLTFAAVLAYGPCITFLTRMRTKLIHDEEHHLRLSPSFWFVYSAFIKQGTSLSPEANTTRVLFATWWLFIILLSAFYTANLTAFLTLSKFTLDIQSPQDLYKKNYRWVAEEGDAVELSVKTPNDDLFYLSKMVASGRAEFLSGRRVREFLSVVDNGAVFVKEASSIEYFMYKDYLRKTRGGIPEADRCTYVVAPNPFMKKSRAFAYPRGSKLKRLFDPDLMYILQSGIIDFLEYRDVPSTKICPLDLQSKDRQLRNSDLMMTYMIMVIGLAAAAAVFILEVIIKRYICKVTSKGSNSKKSKRKRDTSFYDHSRPPPYETLFGKKYNINESSVKKVINGREYYVVATGNGGKRLIPVRAPSAFLYR